jgi:hypothetical protein
MPSRDGSRLAKLAGSPRDLAAAEQGFAGARWRCCPTSSAPSWRTTWAVGSCNEASPWSPARAARSGIWSRSVAGTVSVDMDPLSLVSRLAAAVHPPKFHTVRYGGILAPHAKWRPLVIPPPSPETATSPPTEDVCHSLPMDKNTKARPLTHRCGYIPWQRLMRQLGIDVETCPRCRGDSPRKSVVGGPGKMKVIALVRDPESIARYLRHLGLPTEEPSMAPARGPPFWQSRVLRRRYGDPTDAGQA